MSNTSDAHSFADIDGALDADTPPHAENQPLPVNVYPLLGLALAMASATLTCAAAYFFLTRW